MASNPLSSELNSPGEGLLQCYLSLSRRDVGVEFRVSEWVER